MNVQFRGRGDSSERTGHPGGLPPPAGNTWLFSTCISHQCYTNLNQPHFKYLSPNSFTFFAGHGERSEFRGRGDSSERTGHPGGLPPPAGNTWLFSTCISRQCYTNLNQPHFKYLSPNSFTFFAGCGECPEAEETAVKGPDTPGDSHHQQVTLGSFLHA